MSSPSLSDLGKSEKAALDERGTQQRRAGANATWNSYKFSDSLVITIESIHNGVISVFQRKGLQDNELYNLNEGVRRLLKTELGSFFTEYLQNQLLTKGMVILRDKIKIYEGQKLLDSLSETWDFFFSDVLPMLQAIFYPVQGKDPSVRQLSLLHFRNIIALNVKLDDAISRPRARIPPSIIQMLLILQGVHECKGVTEDYLKLESLIQKVVSPYLGTYGMLSEDGTVSHCCCILENRLLRHCSKSGDVIGKNPVVRSKSYNNPLLTPVAEYESEIGSLNGTASIRRHSVSEITSCLGLQGYSNLTTITDVGSKSSMSKASSSGEEDPSSILRTASSNSQQQGIFDDFSVSKNSLQTLSQSSSPETMVDQILESVDSDSEGIFIDFTRHCSDSPEYSREPNRQNVM
ncbi:proline-rich protein 5 isoform X1 [Polypterus senegalus]|uniref:proline-rich protein 5 isoform X1 n=2 Tax=Polypterus senegalus TaxID=55291 RepID=UPI001966784F|nr:proline-rich protein 5 isoform X1 [Polypterus senegalus]XP_039625936.1 proline-rich protein 5 isoform X1 [Polypterus senegalus]